MSDSTSFVSKPARGWLHPDSVLASEGVTYAVRYIGCMEVLTSMKKLDFETRSQVAKECIARVCAAAGLRSADKKRRVSSAATRALAAKSKMSHSGSNVALTVSSRAISLSALEGGETIARHEMPKVSFASGGDSDSLDFVAYVAKSAPPTELRACYVLECGGRLAQDVIATIGQAFELRYKEFLTKPSSLSLNGDRALSGEPGIMCGPDDREYYNDLPGKIPPDSSTATTMASTSATVTAPIPTTTGPLRQLPPPLEPLSPFTTCEESTRHYVNQTPPPRTPPTALLPMHHTDIFDMQPFTATPVTATAVNAMPEQEPKPEGNGSDGNESGEAAAVLSPQEQAALLELEPWFHGPISRNIAEKLVVDDGEFLVRESVGCPGQFVLTGAHRGAHKHLLLVDPAGIVRTKDRIFDSVPHLINYHCNNELPIVSADSALLLRKPVLRPDALS
ncbi:SHC-transforming protein 1 [Eumeta japonica]|uniref:SHC-transforming protein 1 n=1 Tax=Eumeta variegata TaxID=151549 RepID=A0A4C1Y0M6_EUMVA|nr:SHC-transforming protein 1 [Eumeta japonica]